ncbi:hypothetical protein AB0J63_21410 [Streptosporangium canum]|uniref:hypothetical protein n=1 Tax=Streptosporangium canum TaxID=324952 RepID=UPI003439F398
MIEYALTRPEIDAERVVLASSSRRWPQPPTSDAVLFAEVPNWGFASQPCVFSEVVTVSASENTIFSEVG